MGRKWPLSDICNSVSQRRAASPRCSTVCCPVAWPLTIKACASLALSYDNAKLAHALIVSGHATGQSAVLQRGLDALRWLTELQMSEKGHFRPIGSNGFYRRGGPRADFDQQPIEAQAMVSACLEAYRATSDIWWYEHAQRAFDWFLGWNDLGLELYSPESGACGDGLHVDRVNGNQGAESTLAFLLSLAEMRLAQNMVTSFREPIAIGA